MRKILDKYAAKTGCDIEAMLDIACEYIENQGSNDAFEDFVAQQTESKLTGGLQVGDKVLVGKPDPNGPWNNEFVGRITKIFTGYADVVDQDGYGFAIPFSKLTKHEG